jgi:glycosyltransferase involved in cell wall biosynthesis
MRIAVWHNLPSGGGQRALYDHVRGLVQAGHEVEIFSPPSADRKTLDINALAPYHEVPLRPARLSRGDVPAWLCRAVPELPMAIPAFSLSAMDEHCRVVAKKVNAGGFDVLFSGSCMEFNAPPIARYVSIPTVLYLQEPHRLLYEAPNIWGRALPALSPRTVVFRAVDLLEVGNARRQVREERENAAAFGTILVNSFFSAESVARAYDLPSRVCYLGVDPSLWRLEHRHPGATSVVGVGAVVPHKRIDFVLEAVAAGGLCCRLSWIGNDADPEYAAKLRERADKLGVEFTLHVALTHGEMLEVLAEASLLAYAPRLEPFGYAPLECGAAGIPTVAVAEGGMRETVVDGVNGLLVRRDPKEMGSAIRALLEDEPLRGCLGEGAKKVVAERWSLEAATRRLEAELSRAVR